MAATAVTSPRNRVRQALAACGGVVARGRAQSRVGRPVATPFATGRVVEGARVEAIPVGSAVPAPEPTGFLDGIQRWAVDGHVGVTPVVRCYVAAAVLVRRNGRLTAAVERDDTFLAVPEQRLTDAQRTALDAIGLDRRDTTPDHVPHPILDLQAAGRLAERRREALEREAARAFLEQSADPWLVVDGGLGGLAAGPHAGRVIGLIKSHETQFLNGTDLDTALTLPCGARSSVFVRTQDRRHDAYSWYLRLWPWSDEDLLHGLLRVERRADPSVIAEASNVSRWLLGERAPIAGPDARWDRLIYPMHEVETYLKARAGEWA